MESDPHLYALEMWTNRENRRERLSRSVVACDVSGLAELLRAAEEAHAGYEAVHGSDADWPTWYAEYLLAMR
jgi:hypothetical protein